MWHNTMNTLMQLAKLKRAGITISKVREGRWYAQAVDLFAGPFATRREAITDALSFLNGDKGE